MLLKKILGYLNLLKKLNILKTLYFNFKVFPVQIAVKTPVYFFGPVKFGSLTGKITLEVAEISRGMIHFGSDSERVIVSNQPTSLAVEGELVFCGVSKFGFALQLFVWSNGKLIIGDNCWIGSFTRLIAFRSITIGNNFLASWDCQLFDTNFHFIEDTINDTIDDTTGTIVIKDNVWFGNRVSILKNTFIPADCIVASGSVCNKDYSIICEAGSVIGGIPAKFIKSGVRYLKNKQIEMSLFRHFQQPVNFNRTVNKKDFEK